ncbi:DUF5000 domain-containing lipoprotein [Pedobacter sp. SYP-B3415]|uniref:DUF5000 domain-containing lipoprotein n=1 Tax=Pedobacter sp. SYP-B3415 TaxID=2496641 RepID=UPI0013EA3E6A|nr:DUF5000 domain-containing lipoprotein [Pedobacter sp. SYP-B3415]
MKTNIMKNIMICCGLLLLFLGCKDSKIQPFDQDDAAPAPVSNVRVTSLPGGASFTYTRPDNMLYVKAVYSIRPGQQREVKATYYKNTITIDGFADTGEHEVSLYAVSRGENASAPVVVKFKPLTPPIVGIFESLKFESIFGGVRLLFSNISEADIVINLLRQDDLGEYVAAETFYTKRKEGSVNARGFQPQRQKFGVYLRDRWSNHSDTMYFEATPLLEQLLDKTKFKELRLPTDTYVQHINGPGMASLWDNTWNSGTVFHTKPGTGLPQWFTFDLGESVALSRFKMYHRLGGGQQSSDGAYAGGDPKSFELYGSNGPNANGTWESWELIGEFESVKPSGSPAGTVTSEDFQFAVVNGEEFDVPVGTPKYRYLRWKTKRVWGLLDHIYLSELTFWGNKQ